MTAISLFQKLLSSGSICDEIFDSYRIVDADQRVICKIEKNTVTSLDIPCYHLWEKETSCYNCISFRAQREKKQIMKLEYLNDAVYLVIAFPIEIDQCTCVLELVKDISDSLVVSEKTPLCGSRLSDLIDQFNKLSVTDAYTDLFNKKYIDKQIPDDIAFSRKNSSSLIAVMIDIDDFKGVNDTYGHHTGDMVIYKVAKLMQSCIADHHCWAARYGGEEFLVVCHNETMDAVYNQCEKLKSMIAQIDIPTEGSTLHVTASFGIYQFDPAQDDAITFLEKADKKLYESKHKGKDMISF